MTNNTTKDQVLSLFPDNVNNEISAADMRVFIESVFNDKEVKIVKIQYMANLAANNANIYEGTIVVIWGDESAYNGFYLSKVNQPTLSSDLIKLSGLIENPEASVNPLLTYDYTSITPPIVLTSDVYSQVTRLTTPPRVQGTYEIKMSMLYSYDNVNNSAYFRWSEDGGSTWNEIQEEPKDTTNKIPKSFFHTEVFGGGIKDIIIEARCEIPADTLTIFDMHIVFQRVQ